MNEDAAQADAFNPSNPGDLTSELTDELRARLDSHFDEFEEGVKSPSFDAQNYISRLVGVEFLRAATNHYIAKRVERMRAAARARGMDLGI